MNWKLPQKKYIYKCNIISHTCDVHLKRKDVKVSFNAVTKNLTSDALSEDCTKRRLSSVIAQRSVIIGCVFIVKKN